jgi:hypothetical protein
VVQPAAKAAPTLARDHCNGEIPWCKASRNPEWLLDRQDPLVGICGGDDFPVCPLRFSSKPVEEGGSVGDFAFCFCEWLSVLQSQNQSEVVNVFQAEIVPSPEPARSLSSCCLFVCLKGFMGGSDCDFGVGGRHFWQRGDGLEGRGVGDIECDRAGGVDPFSCDVSLLLKEVFTL